MAADHGDPLKGHPRYRKIQDLSAGAFGFVQARQFWLCVCLSLSLARDLTLTATSCRSWLWTLRPAKTYATVTATACSRLGQIGPRSICCLGLPADSYRSRSVQVAIKFIPRGPSKITKHVEREIINHSNFCHPHVVQFKEVFLTAQFLAIAMVRTEQRFGVSFCCLQPHSQDAFPCRNLHLVGTSFTLSNAVETV